MTRILLISFILSNLLLPLQARQASYYINLEDNKIQCLLCPRECILEKGQTGYCHVRKNINGKLESLVYAKPCSLNIDPIEKKPYFHFLPGTPSLSIATVGCNLRCVFCQNWSISQVEPGDVNTMNLTPEQVVEIARNKKCPSISYTYSEPTSFYEYMYDTALIAKKNGIKNTWVTCGYINPEPLEKLCTVIDAANVDLKGFSNSVYRKVAGAKLDPILETLKILKQNNVWLEVGYLVIPTINDSEQEITNMAKWVVENLGADVPVHFLRFFPKHKLTNLMPTPVETLEKAYKIAKDAGLNYVYLGNVAGHKSENTYCPKCKKLIIKRRGYFIDEINIKNGNCKFCGKKIAGVWK